jgi:glycosyltransferase involved in cell wall biosynthesis
VRVALDVSHLNHTRLSGIGIYTMQLLHELRTMCDVTPVYRPRRLRHRTQMAAHVGTLTPWLFGGIGLGADVIHGPDFRAPSSRRAARVVTILDLSFLDPKMTTPGFAHRMRERLDALLDRDTPDAIIAISDHTRNALIEYRPTVASRTHTVWLGGDHLRARVGEDAPQGKPPHERPYFLFVSNIETRKNVLGLLAAFEQCATSLPEFDLIMIGKPGHEAEQIMMAIARSPVAGRIHVLGYRDDAALAQYYRYATAFVYPSWLEGFGIPVVEAMSFGCPVITSRTTSTAEIIGDTNWGVDPANTQEIADAMCRVAGLDLNARSIAQERSREQSAHFSWHKCAEATLGVYQLAIHQRAQ